MSDSGNRYAFPHGHKDERRRLELLQQRLDPITIRRIEQLGLAPGVRCLEVGGGRGSITRWLCEQVGVRGLVTATDLDTGFLAELSLPNLKVLRHDVRTDDFAVGSFDFVHERAVLMSYRGPHGDPPADGLVACAGRVAAAQGQRFRHVGRGL